MGSSSRLHFHNDIIKLLNRLIKVAKSSTDCSKQAKTDVIDFANKTKELFTSYNSCRFISVWMSTNLTGGLELRSKLRAFIDQHYADENITDGQTVKDVDSELSSCLMSIVGMLRNDKNIEANKRLVHILAPDLEAYALRIAQYNSKIVGVLVASAHSGSGAPAQKPEPQLKESAQRQITDVPRFAPIQKESDFKDQLCAKAEEFASKQMSPEEQAKELKAWVEDIDKQVDEVDVEIQAITKATERNSQQTTPKEQESSDFLSTCAQAPARMYAFFCRKAPKLEKTVGPSSILESERTQTAHIVSLHKIKRVLEKSKMQLQIAIECIIQLKIDLTEYLKNSDKLLVRWWKRKNRSSCAEIIKQLDELLADPRKLESTLTQSESQEKNLAETIIPTAKLRYLYGQQGYKVKSGKRKSMFMGALETHRAKAEELHQEFHGAAPAA